MAKKKKQTRKSTKMKPAAKAVSSSQIGTKCIGTVVVPYVQVGVPDAHAVDVAEAIGQLILSDVHRSFLRDRDSEI